MDTNDFKIPEQLEVFNRYDVTSVVVIALFVNQLIGC